MAGRDAALTARAGKSFLDKIRRHGMITATRTADRRVEAMARAA